MIRVRKDCAERISQGDIYRDVPMVEYVTQVGDNIEASSLEFPYVIVLTQDCDLAQDPRMKTHCDPPARNDDKRLLSVLVAPVYNAVQVFAGVHLQAFGLMMEPISVSKTPGKNIKNNLAPRYHYLEFPPDVRMVPSIIDFKHYFSVNLKYLLMTRKEKYVCQVSELYREDISHRFAGFLSRIGLPPDDATAPPAEPESGSAIVSHVGENPALLTR